MKPLNLTNAIKAYNNYIVAKLCNERGYAKDDDVKSASLEFFDATAPLRAALGEAQARSRERTITVENVLDACNDIDDALKISNKAKAGTTAVVDPNAQNFAKAYGTASHGRRPMSTQFSIFYKNNAWYLNNVQRDYCRPYGRGTSIMLSETAKEAIIDRIERGDL